jgi:putative ABC transport system permease protein
MTTWLQDIRYAVRMLRRSPGFAVVAIGVLALGIGANTAIFSLVRAVLLDPLPFADANRVVGVMEQWRGRSGNVSAGMFADLKRSQRSFDRLAAVRYSNLNLALGEGTERVLGARVTEDFFGVFGVPPQFGRVFRPDEDRPGQNRVAVLSHRLWAGPMGAAPSVLGQTVRLDGDLYTIVGVMPAAFDYVRENEEVWIPAALPPEVLADHDNHNLVVFGLLRPGVTSVAAQADAAGIMRVIRHDFPQEAEGRDFAVQPFKEMLVEGYQDRLLILFAAVGLVLLIACLNVSNMLLARATVRTRELTVRSAIGASRGRIARQLLTENLVLGIAGGGLGVLLASTAVSLLVATSPPGVPRIEQAGLDPGVLAFALAASLTSSLLFGLAPVVRAARGNLEMALRTGGRGTHRGGGRDRVRTALVALQIALVLPLLAGAGLLIRTAMHLQRVKPGFESAGVLTARVSLPRGAYQDPAAIARTIDRVVEELEREPAIASAAVTSQIPLGPGGNSNGLVAEAATLDPSKAVDARLRLVTPHYLKTLRIALVRGRGFDGRDVAGGQRVMIVSEGLARKLWPGQDALGRRVACCEGSPEDPKWKTIVGIATDTRSRGPEEDAYPEFYLPVAQAPQDAWDWIQRTITIAVRAARPDPTSVAAPMRAALRAVAPGVPAYDLRTMDDRLRAALAQERFNTLLLAALGAVGLLLAAVGIYGIVAYFVARRTAEFGVRMALGATARDILWITARHGLPPIGLGLVGGIAASLAATRLLRATLRGVSPTDPTTLAAVVAVLAASAALATYIPARKATRINPSSALRSE